jgi:hypothetical protein
MFASVLLEQKLKWKFGQGMNFDCGEKRKQLRMRLGVYAGELCSGLLGPARVTSQLKGD